jgi:hypothetical protein
MCQVCIRGCAEVLWHKCFTPKSCQMSTSHVGWRHGGVMLHGGRHCSLIGTRYGIHAA